MSVQAMTWAFEQDVEPNAKLVLLALANRTNHETGVCYPGQELLGRECSMSDRTIRRHLNTLEERRLIQRRARMLPEGRGRTSDEYRLACYDQPAKMSGRSRPTGQRRTTNRTKQDDQPDNVVQGTEREPKGKNLAAKPRERQPDILFDATAKACNINTGNLTASARGALNRAVKELRDVNATPEQIAAVAKSYRNHYPNATLTPMALVKHWSAFVKPDTPERPSIWDTYQKPEWY
jgi:DNA-binding transcriptional MocR family regulator